MAGWASTFACTLCPWRYLDPCLDLLRCLRHTASLCFDLSRMCFSPSPFPRHEEHAECLKMSYAHRLREAPIRGDIRYRRAADGRSRRCVLAFVSAGGCGSRCACFWIQPRIVTM